MGKPNFTKRERRYQRDADVQTIHPETLKRWPRRWLLFGPRSLPVLTFVRAQAHLHSTMQRRLNRAEGQLRAANAYVEKLKASERRTQDYIRAMKGRLDEAAGANLTVAEFLEQDRRAARAFLKSKLQLHLGRFPNDREARAAVEQWEHTSDG